MPETAVQSTSPGHLSEVNFRANLAALAVRQRAVAAFIQHYHAGELAELEWVFGRDAALTARDAQGRWWGGSSLPGRVGKSIFSKLDLNGAVGCLLAPGTGGQLRAVLEKIAPEQAIIAILPDITALLVALRCEDLSCDIAGGRLWLAAGEGWQEHLAAIMEENSGLCVPLQYIRSGVADEMVIGELIEAANGIISRETGRRARVIAEIRQAGGAKAADRFCVIAGSKFSLDDLSGPALAQALCEGEAGWARLDISRPTSASPLALAEAARDCRAVIAADLFRAELPDVVADDVAWVTWVTKARVAPPVAGAGRDWVLPADHRWRQMAIDAGWKGDRIKTAGWPNLADSSAGQAPERGPVVMIANAAPLEMPEQLKEFSSHGVLWEQIAAELAGDPFAVGDDVETFLSSRIARFDIDAQKLDRGLFISRLILPAWRRSVARLMIRAGLPLVLFGDGWEGDFAANFGAPVFDLDALRRLAKLARAIVHPLPSRESTFAQALGRAVVVPRRAAPGQWGLAAGGQSPLLSREMILSLL